jgi:predicted hotdog family 3-hydroxylacyl-ACP dehydratase
VGRLNRDEIAARLPHAGAMCLLDAVSAWDDTTITCTTRSHQQGENPLRLGDHLPAICGLEYGAQAMAVHCGLLAGDTEAAPAAGYLGGLRDLSIHAPFLDDAAAELTVRARRVFGDRSAAIYTFDVRDGARLLIDGRLSVFLQYRETTP